MANLTYLRYDNTAIQQSGGAAKLISGGASADSLVGSAANEAFTGNGGADTLVGGGGDDTYVIQNTISQVVETAGGGIDTVKATVNYILPNYVENLLIMGDGPKGGLTGVGNSLDNLIVGNTATQTLIGLGGNDVLVGGGGNDTFVVGNHSGHDVITDFTAGKGAEADALRFSDGSFTSFAQVKAAMTQVGADVVLKLSATDDVTFRNTTIGTFTADNFKTAIDLSKYTLTFSDEFNALNLQTLGKAGTGTWATEFGFGGYGGKGSHFIGNYTGETQIYVDSTYKGSGTTALGINPFSVKDGVLTITSAVTNDAQKAALYGINYTSGLLTTKTSFQQTYGYFEMRAEMPTGTGAWPAFWLASSTTSAEIDILEVVSENPNFINMTIHDKSYTGGTIGGSAYIPGAATGFHTYGLLWTAETLTYYIDGAAVYQVATPDSMHGPMYLLVNQAVDGWAAAPDPNNMPTGFQIDYVHAYSLEAPPVATPAPTPSKPEAAQDIVAPEPAKTVTTLDGLSANYQVYQSADGGYELYSAKTGATMHLSAGTELKFSDLTQAASAVVKGSAVGGTEGNDHLSLTHAGLLNGGGGDDLLQGSTSADVLIGGAGADTLDGGQGADILVGGAGDDTYVVDNAGDTILELTAEGVDTVRTTLSGYTLGWNLENLAYAGTGAFTGVGNTLDNVITGGAGADNLAGGLGTDTLNGGAGNDTLDGGVGADVLVGGAGDDVYQVDNKLDTIIEAVGGGYDTVNVTAGYVLPSGAEIERIVMSASTTAMNVTGNEFSQVIVGNAGINLLDGGGGADTLIGGAGNDTYIIDHAGEKVVELANEGLDLVKTTLAAYALTDNVESLTYTGTGNFAGTGNALANVIIGGAGNDTLDGGVGADRLVGGLGNDTYYVDSASDTITENAGEGYDTQITTLVSAKAAANIEALIYSGSLNFTGYANATGTAITGGAGNDTLVGGVGNDTLSGGAGTDYLSGGAGADVFHFAGLNLGVDKIADFQVGVDHIALKATAFGITSLADVTFVSGTAPTGVATDHHATLLYNTSTGALYFDANGGDGADKVQIATLANKAAIHLSDFWLA
ncbi:hypothetical protein BH10PSE4_BH10PSE4_07260 [soil metagenome]